MSHLVPVRDYTAETTAQMSADHEARRRRFFPSLVLVNRESVRPTVPIETPELEPESSSSLAIDIPDFLALRPKATEWLGMAPKAAFRQSEATIILRLVSEHTGMSLRELKSNRRTRDVVRPRMIACWLLRRGTGLSLPVIGRKLGGRDHTTVLHSIRVIDALRAADPEIAELTDMLMRRVEEAIAPEQADEDDRP